MKKLVYSILTVVFAIVSLALTLASASALSTDLQDSTITLGGPSQEASNYDNNAFGVYVTGQIVFDSTNPITLTDVLPESLYVQSTDTVVIDNINVTILSQSIGVNSSTVTLSARVPEILPAVNPSGEEMAFKVAQLTFNDGAASVNVDLKMQRENHLEFHEIILKYSQDDEKKLKDGKDIKDLKPGENLALDFEIENTYSTSDDVEIEEVEVYVADDNNDLDVDEEESVGDIREDDKETETLSFDIEDDLDEDDYDLILRTIGFDEYGARHGERWVITLEVEKEKNEVSIQRLSVDPDMLDTCQTSYATISVNIENTGRRDQNNAAIVVSNDDLGYRQQYTDIDLDEDDSSTRTFNVRFPSDAVPGSYRFVVKAYYDFGETASEEKSITVFVRNCDFEMPTNDNDGNSGDYQDNDGLSPSTEVEIIGSSASISGITSAQPAVAVQQEPASSESGNKGSFLSTRMLLLLLVIVVLLILLIIIFGFRR